MMNRAFFTYGWRIVLFSLFLLLASVIFCYAVDPFSVYGKYAVKEGLKVNGLGFSYQDRMCTAIAIKQRKPEVLILGSSRSFYGFSHKVVETYLNNKNTYNASLPAISIYELLRYFQHTVAVAPVKQVYIGIDFYQFHGTKPNIKTFSDERLAVNIDNEAAGNNINDLISTLLSGDAVYFSIKALLGSVKWHEASLENGFKFQDNSGGLSSFLYNEKGYVEDVYTRPEFTFYTENQHSNTFEYFRKIVQLAYEKNVELKFFISPSHARQWEIIAQLGLWEKWEYWKREVLHITLQESFVYKQPAFPIHDFSGYSIYSTEEVPREEGKNLTWYSDSSHFKQNLGAILMADMIKGFGKGDFGRILNSQNIDNHLQVIRDGRKQYLITHKQDVADIKKIISEEE